MIRRTVLSVRSVANASGTHGNHSAGLWAMQVVHTVTTVLQNHHTKKTEYYEVRYELIRHVIFSSIAHFISCESKHFR